MSFAVELFMTEPAIFKVILVLFKTCREKKKKKDQGERRNGTAQDIRREVHHNSPQVLEGEEEGRAKVSALGHGHSLST